MGSTSYSIKQFSTEQAKKPQKGELFNLALSDMEPDLLETYDTKEDALKALKEYESFVKRVGACYIVMVTVNG